jgi:PilX N-terminal
MQITMIQRSTQTGATLATALIFLVVISLLSVTSIRSGTMGVRMSQNEEARFAAIQAAQALTEAIVASPASTPVIGGAGFSICTVGEPGCNLYTIVAPVGYVADQVAAGNLSSRVERLTPPEKPPPRVLESSIDKFSAGSFQVIATFDRTDEQLGRAQLVEGLLVLVPKL